MYKFIVKYFRQDANSFLRMGILNVACREEVRHIVILFITFNRFSLFMLFLLLCCICSQGHSKVGRSRNRVQCGQYSCREVDRWCKQDLRCEQHPSWEHYLMHLVPVNFYHSGSFVAPFGLPLNGTNAYTFQITRIIDEF